MNLKPLILLIALPSLADAQSNTFYIQQRAPIVTQNTNNQGTTYTQGINPYTGQIWANTTQANGYTYGQDANGNTYSGNLQQNPVQRALTNIMIQQSQNLGAQMGSSFYNATNGGK